MALKISLKANEKLIIGGAVVTNGNTRSDLIIENSVPILREKDILSEHDATSPCRRIYFLIQLMYVDEKNLPEHHKVYWELVREVLRAAPSTLGLIDQINEHLVSSRYYQALKLAWQLIEYEEEVTRRVRESDGSLQRNA
jgi:flagellar protein FlbT